MKLSKLAGVFCLLSGLLQVYTASAQIDTLFMAHLTRNGLHREQLVYLNSFPPSDTLSYLKAVFFLDREGKEDLFLHNYKKAGLFADADTTLAKRADAHFLLQPKDLSNEWFNSVRRGNNQGVLARVFAAAENPRLFSGDDFVPELGDVFMRYRKLSLKKPLVAAGLSAAVPGLGKLYAGKPGSALTSLLICATYAVQLAESHKVLGMAHPLSVINLSAFSMFYISGIYGSYTGLIRQRKEYKKQFIHDALFYYR